MAHSIRQLILQIQSEVHNSKDLLPERATELLTELSAIFGNVSDEIRHREGVYNKVLLECYENEKSANRAKIKAMTTPEYESYREAKDSKDLIVEMTRGLKYFIRTKEQELLTSKYQT